MDDFLKNISATLAKQGAPMLAGIIGTAIGGPVGAAVGGLAGKALETVADTLRVDAAPADLPAAIDAKLRAEGPLAAPAIVAAEAKASDLIRLQELENERIKAELADVQASRAQMAALVERGSPMQYMQAVLTGINSVAFYGVLGLLIAKGLPDSGARDLVSGMIGAVVGAYIASNNFWFGSSIGSKSKDALLAKR